MAVQSAGLAKPWANEPMLSKTLYVFDLPQRLLANLQLRSIDAAREDEEGISSHDEQAGPSGRPSTQDDGGQRQQSTSGCTICPGAPPLRGATEVRSHLRSDWHRYNVGLNKRGKQDDALNEEAFHKLVEELSSSDGSDVESDGKENTRAPSDTVSTLLSRLRLRTTVTPQTDSSDEGGERESSSIVARESHLWFVTKPDGPTVMPQTQFGILRQLFPEPDGEVVAKDWHTSILARMQPKALTETASKSAKRLKGASAAEEAASMLGVVFMDASGENGAIGEDDGDSDVESTEGGDDRNGSSSLTLSTPSTQNALAPPLRTWTIILLGGGDFAAIVVALNPYEHLLSARKGSSERQLFVLARKQFHRYTTRRKQGGAQSTLDASGKFAKSAGAQLRRYGEQQLGQEIRELLDRSDWRQAIQKSDRIWVRAGLRTARGTLWGWSAGGAANESPLEEMRRRDAVRTLPIATRKPTVGECLRCFAELTRVRVRHETEEEMASRDAAYRAQLEGSAKARQERRQRQKERLQREAEQRQATKKRGTGPPKLDLHEQFRRERLVRLIDMVRKGRLDNVVKHLEKYEADLLKPDGWDAQPKDDQEPDDVDEAMELARKRINTPLPLWWRYLDAREKGALLHGPADSVESQLPTVSSRQRLVPSTLLQIAAEGGHESLVSYLLVDRLSDPASSVPPPPHSDALNAEEEKRSVAQASMDTAMSHFPHRTAYDLCSSRAARDVFRRLMAAEPTWCAHWSGMEKGGARVPKALTEEMEETRSKEEHDRDKRQSLRDRARKRQEEEEKANAHTITKEDRERAMANKLAGSASTARSAAHGDTNRLGGSNTAPRALQKQLDDAAGLTPEMRARIEREKRARAAEARFKGLQG